MEKIKEEYKHGFNTLLTRISLTLYSLRSSIFDSKDKTYIDKALIDIKILERRINNLFALIVDDKNPQITQINIEALSEKIYSEFKGVKVTFADFVNRAHLVSLDEEIFSEILREIYLYFGLDGKEIIGVSIKSSNSIISISIISRNDSLKAVTYKDLEDEQLIRRAWIMRVLKSQNWEVVFNDLEINLNLPNRQN